MAALAALPNEILSLVTNHLEHPRDLLYLSLANRRLYEFTKLDGWNAYLKGRFGLSGRGTDARITVHGLTTLYRNWNRKALVSRYLTPSNNTRSLNTWETKPWRSQYGQTMGYQPRIDSYDEEQGNWSDRREVLAWSAGTHVVMRVRETGTKAAKFWDDGFEREAFDAYKHLHSWYTYQIPESSEGRDDITALKLLRPHQRNDESDCVLFGTASGDLSLLQVDLEGQQIKKQQYDTQHRAVSSLSISQSDNPLMAAILDNSDLALFSASADALDEDERHALGHIGGPDVFGVQAGRPWSCNFISDDMVAVGLGPTSEPIQIFGITPAGFSPGPLRKFRFDYTSGAGRNTSVYPIVPLPPESQAGGMGGEVFLSGAYDGIIRLHDMRSPRDLETIFWDVTNDNSLYSLAIQGAERVIAGSSMHSMLKVFDLRFSGSNQYQTIALPTKHKTRTVHSATGDYTGNKIARDTIDHTGTTPVTGGWNLFLHPRHQRTHRTRGQPRDDSPIYSLSIPSATSPSLYAGLEGAVMGLDFHSVMDKHPDPVFSNTIERFPESGHIDIKSSYNRFDDVLSLGMYEQGNEQSLDMKLMIQGGVDNELIDNKVRRDQARFSEFDERWKDPSDEGERWTRGQQPQGQQPQHRRGRGGRGRGRGRGNARGH